MVLALFSVAVPATADQPSWYPSGDARTYPPEKYLIGGGACGNEVSAAARPACAVKKAREQLTLSINASVKVYVEQKTVTITRRSNGRPASLLRTTDALRLGKEEGSADIDGSQPVQHSCDAKASLCYALIALPRAELAQGWRRKWEGLAGRERPLLEAPAGEDPLAALRRLKRARELALRMDALSGWIAAVTDPRRAPPDALVEVERAESAVLATSVCLGSSDVAAGAVFAKSRQTLSSAGFAAARLAGAHDCESVALGFVFSGSWQPLRPSETGLQVRDIAGSLAVWRDGGVIGASTSVNGHGVAQTAERAEREALDQLSEQVARTIVGLLGR
jgi:hypothetical protein